MTGYGMTGYGMTRGGRQGCRDEGGPSSCLRAFVRDTLAQRLVLAGRCARALAARGHPLTQNLRLRVAQSFPQCLQPALDAVGLKPHGGAGQVQA